MNRGTTLRGMTWDHPRGFDPLVACSRLWRDETGVEVRWDKRSLQDFESYAVEELARRYDLIVIDHPHVGAVTAAHCLVPLANTALEDAWIGRSLESYRWNGVQWALPIDAAAQVQAWRPDLLAHPAKTLDEVMALAEGGRVLCPLRPPHSLMVFFTLAANLGAACATNPPRLIDPEHGMRVYGMMQKLVARMDHAAFDMDPIAALEYMARADARIACIPLVYGYVSYARDGFRERRLAFADIPSAGRDGPVGSVLGGTGIAVSARSDNQGAAVDFALWLASGEVQRGPYAAAGGQPGHAAAWADPQVNAPVHNFYSATRATLEGAWLRPRHNGYMAFQDAAAKRINEALRAEEGGEGLIRELNARFRASFGDAA